MTTYDYDHPSAVEATAAMPAMFAALREALTLDDDDPRRIAALAEKNRVLALMAEAERPRSNGHSPQEEEKGDYSTPGGAS